MKALRILSFVLVLVLAFSGCAKNETKNETPEVKSESTTKNGEKSKDTDNNKFYYCTHAEGEINVTYHVKDCKLLEGKQAMEVNSEFVTMIGLKRCKSCNPPEIKN